MNLNESDQTEKKQLEIEKLRREIANLRRWWVPPVIGAAPTLVAILFSFVIAWCSGILDAKRDRNAIEAMRVEEREKKAKTQVESLERDIAELRIKLSPMLDLQRQAASEERAMTLIRRMLPHSHVSNSQITLSGQELTFDENNGLIIPSGLTPVAADGLQTALRALDELQNLQTLRIVGLALRPEDLLRIQRIPILQLTCNGIDDSAMESLWMTEVMVLKLNGQKLTKLPSFDGATKLERLEISSDVLLNHSDFNGLLGCKRLMTLDIPVVVDDDAFSRILSLSNLTHLEIPGNSLSAKSILAIAEHPKLRMVWLARCNSDLMEREFPMLRHDLTAQIREKNPKIHIFPRTSLKQR